MDIYTSDMISETLRKARTTLDDIRYDIKGALPSLSLRALFEGYPIQAEVLTMIAAWADAGRAVTSAANAVRKRYEEQP